MRKVICMLLAVVASATFADEVATTAPAKRSWADYRAVVDRNIFVKRSRSGRSESTPRVSVPATIQAAPQSSLVLTGTVLVGAERVAFIEDRQTKQTIRVHAGQTIAAGRVWTVGLDYIELETGGTISRVGLGDSMGAAAAPPPVPASTATAPSSDPVSVPEASGGDSSVLERMRARRNQELSK